MKKLVSFLLAVICCCSLSLTAFASPEQTTTDKSFSITTEDRLLPLESSQGERLTLYSQPKVYDIDFTELDEVPMVIKHYIMEPNLNTETLFPETIKIGGKTYTIYDILEKTQPPITKVKTVKVPITLSSDTDNKNMIVAELPQTMEYNEGGFTGTLALNTDSLNTEVTGTTSYSYPTRTTKEFTGLDRADLSYIPKSHNGMGLIDVTWTSLGGAQRGDMMVPSSYTATALYGGTGTGSKVTGYDSTAFFVGEVSQEIPSQSFYKVIYQKTPTPKENAKEILKESIAIIIIIIVSILIFKLLISIMNTEKRKN